MNYILRCIHEHTSHLYARDSHLEFTNQLNRKRYSISLTSYPITPQLSYSYALKMSRLAANTQAALDTEAGGAALDQYYNKKFASNAQYNAVIAALTAQVAIIPANSTPAQVANFMLRFALVCADMGTSTATDYDGITITNATLAAPVNVTTIVNIIKPIVSVRRLMRTLADTVYAHAKLRKMKFAVGTSHGVPKDLAHVGFDYADGISPDRLSLEEALAIDAAKRVGLFKAAANAVSNTAALYHRGTAPATHSPQGLLTG